MASFGSAAAVRRLTTARSSLPLFQSAAAPARSSCLATTSRRISRQPSSHSRTYATGPSSSTGGSGGFLVGAVVGAAAAGAGAYYYFASSTPTQDAKAVKDAAVGAVKSSINTFQHKPKAGDYQAVYNAIAKLLEERDEYEDGSYGPVLVRLAWHASGTYDAQTKTGGSNGATMRFDPESDHGANNGLATARDFLNPVKEQFPWISYSDLWTLGGVAAVQEMQGPIVPWRPGRSDRDESWCTPDGRLPDGAKEQKHLRAIFGRMGFNDQEIVALSGAHALGRCHTDRSGFEGPWTFSPTVVTNDYYRLLMDEKWNVRDWSGPKQFQDNGSKTLMMLPTDIALVADKKFKPWVEKYATDNELFFKDFSNVLCKLFELGVPFNTKPDSRFEFKKFSEAAATAAT